MQFQRCFIEIFRGGENSSWCGWSSDELPSLFSIAVLLDEEETEEQFNNLKKAVKGVPAISKEKGLSEHIQKDVWKEDIKERTEIFENLKLIFSYVYIEDDKIKKFLDSMKSEDDNMKQYKDMVISEEYEMQRLKWYFEIVSLLVYCQGSEKYKEIVEKCRQYRNNAWKSIWKAVDIVIEDYVNKGQNTEKRNTNIFFGVTEEALDELQLAYSNADGWLLEDLSDGYKEFTLKIIKEFLEEPKEVLDSVQGSYALGMLIGKLFDENSMSQFRRPLFEEGDCVYMNYYCFKKRENTFLWKYYEIFKKIINQIRLNNEDVQKLLDHSTMKMETSYLLDSEGDFSGKGWTKIKADSMVSDIKRELNQGKKELLDEEIRQLYENIPWKAVRKKFAADSIYVGIKSVESTAVNYFDMVGSLIYKDIPNFLNYLEDGDEVSGGLFMKNSQARHAKFMKKYYETLKELSALTE